MLGIVHLVCYNCLGTTSSCSICCVLICYSLCLFYRSSGCLTIFIKLLFIERKENFMNKIYSELWTIYNYLVNWVVLKKKKEKKTQRLWNIGCFAAILFIRFQFHAQVASMLFCQLQLILDLNITRFMPMLIFRAFLCFVFFFCYYLFVAFCCNGRSQARKKEGCVRQVDNQHKAFVTAATSFCGPFLCLKHFDLCFRSISCMWRLQQRYVKDR